MAVVYEARAKCGALVRIHDDDFAEDQEKAWAHARAVHARIHWEIEMEKLRKAKEEAERAKDSTGS